MGASLSSQFAECPVGTRLLAASYVLACVGAPALTERVAPRIRLQLYLLCSLSTVGRGYLSGLLLSAFHRPLRGSMDLMMALAELQMSVASLPSREKDLGSLRFLLWAIGNICGTNVAFLLLMKGLGLMGSRDAHLRVNQGFWSLIMASVTQQ
ncbi:unnamed protein product, partial [Polarella glacialis]